MTLTGGTFRTRHCCNSRVPEQPMFPLNMLTLGNPRGGVYTSTRVGWNTTTNTINTTTTATTTATSPPPLPLPSPRVGTYPPSRQAAPTLPSNIFSHAENLLVTVVGIR